MKPLTWETKRARLKDLVEWELNPVQLSEKDAKHLSKSLDKFEHVLPYVAAEPYPGKNKAIKLLDGHQRKFVEININGVSPDTLVDVRFPSRKLTERERKEIVVRLRKNTGQFDFDKLANAFDVPDLLEWGFSEKELQLGGFEFEDTTQDAEPQIDRAAELLKKWKVRTGDLFGFGAIARCPKCGKIHIYHKSPKDASMIKCECGHEFEPVIEYRHKLICGDCTDAAVVARVMDGEKARMIFTDPPWNVAIGKDSNPRHRQREGLQNDDMSDEDYSSFVASFVASFIDVCDGDVYCKVASEYMDIIGGIFRTQKYHWSATVIWVKDIFVLGRSKYHRRYEPMWYGWHEKSKSSFCDARDLDDVWEIKRPRTSDEHPTMMPVELPTRAINNSSKEGEIVYEPFSGSGTTLVACQNLGRKCRAVEISPAYVAVALQRMHDAFPDLKIERMKAK